MTFVTHWKSCHQHRLKNVCVHEFDCGKPNVRNAVSDDWPRLLLSAIPANPCNYWVSQDWRLFV